MEWLLSAEEMKACDERTIHEIGIPSAALMERAALSVVEEMQRAGMDLSRTLVVCGSGNNGGDGFAIARILAHMEEAAATDETAGTCNVTLAFVGKETSMTEETARQRKICENSGLKISRNFMEHEYTVIVDAIFGIGLSRPVEGQYAEVIRWINSQNAKTVAVDIPSGISADTGRVYGVCVEADLTVTFACRKIGQLLYPGARYCGQLVCRDIGISVENGSRTAAGDAADPDERAADADRRPTIFTYTERDLAGLPERKADSNKGTCGKVLLIAGSEGMSGAAVLAAKAAFRCGCGMVRVLTPECNRAVLQSCLPEAIVTAYEPEAPVEEACNLLIKALLWSDAAGIGPGLGTSQTAAALLKYVLEHYEKPLVIDADGLNLLADENSGCSLSRNDGSASGCRNIILTPHIGEMARLTGKEKTAVSAELLSTARTFAAGQDVICVLKDARTAVSDGRQIYLNTSGNDGMATAGSGDVLTGVICSLLAQKLPCWQAATFGAYLHGLAGDLAKKELGAYGMMAGDIADRVGTVRGRHK
ncbi:MAG: NAD(P)H-hydrate dehydratase [Lachnospiraceae bacterium]|nr:NAD(P)H-hydrate dehydratase [Lachnospiraceae bacterium]